MDKAILKIRRSWRISEIATDNNQLVEAQRLRQRTEYDMEMMAELGYCSASRTTPIISDRPAGSPHDPAGLLPGRLPAVRGREPRDLPRSGPCTTATMPWKDSW